MIDIVFSLFLSHHIGFTKKDFNAVHPHLSVIHDKITVGTYYNSENRMSVYGRYMLYQGWADISAGLSTGYKSNDLLPMLVISRQLTPNLSIMALPSVDNPTKDLALVLGVEYKFK